jgi:hypothetical protein
MMLLALVAIAGISVVANVVLEGFAVPAVVAFATKATRVGVPE